MKKLHVAVIGAGYWGPNIIRNLLKVSSVSKLYVCDIQKSKLVSLKKEFPNISITQDYDDVLKDQQIAAVIIATPIQSHYALAKKALEAGKHVLIEKPMTVTSRESKDLLILAKKRKRVLMVGHTFVYSESVKKIKDAIKQNELGKIYYYDSTRINLGLMQKDSNVVWDLAPHDLAIVSHLFPGKIISVQAFGSSFISKQIEVAHIFLQYEKNISVHIHVSWLSPVKIRSILIGGSKKMVVYNDIEPSEKIKIYDKGIIPSPNEITPFAPAYRSGDVVIPRLEQKEALFTELTHFIDCIIENKTPITDGEDGLRVVQLLEAIDKALRTHKQILL